MKEKLDSLVGRRVIVARQRLGVAGTLQHGRLYAYRLEGSEGWAHFGLSDVEAIDTGSYGGYEASIWLKELIDNRLQIVVN